SKREFLARVLCLDDLAAVAFLSRLCNDLDLSFANYEANGAVTLVGYERHTADGRAHLVKIENGGVLVVLWHDHLVIREIARELTCDQKPAFRLEENVVRILAERNLALAA